MIPLETYLKELSEIRSSGEAVKETSYYGPLANLTNEIGKTLKPKVKCITNLQDQGPDLPDGGPFTPDQFQEPTKAEYWEDTARVCTRGMPMLPVWDAASKGR
ncbi:MAG: hypothetical protein WCF59_09885 [Desulfobaccales bacterium]